MNMREIKVRFWDEVNNKFWHGGEEGEGIGEECFQTFFVEGSLVGMMGESVNVGCGEYDTIERKLPGSQYTGLKDKNGVEIYERDIVESNWGYRFPIFFEDGCYKTESEDFEVINENQINYYELKVIGNIFEHPELLGDDN